MARRWNEDNKKQSLYNHVFWPDISRRLVYDIDISAGKMKKKVQNIYNLYNKMECKMEA